MKTLQKIVIGAMAVLTLGFGTTAYAQTGYLPYDSSYYNNNYNSNYYSGYTQNYTYPYTYPYAYSQPTYAYTQTVSLSQTSLSLAVGQSGSVVIYGSFPFSVSNSNSRAVWHTANGNVLTVQGLTSGSATITVCSGTTYYYGNNCANLVVYVSGYPYNPPYYDGGYYPYPSYNNDRSILQRSIVRIEKGERERIEIDNSSYRRDPYIADNSNSRVASASIDDDELVVRGLREGSTEITVCQGGDCDGVRIIVED